MAISRNKRIAKNTLMLYIRMLFTLLISLYTSRIVLNTLGVDDYGIYNVVGGIVAMFAFINNALASGTQRFLTFELGSGDKLKLRRIFNSSLIIHGMIAIIIIVLSETIGLWFLNTHMKIPAERIVAAHWVYQFSILATVVAVMSVPYNATIIAHEKMSTFAYISILEVSLKLLVVFIIGHITYDMLIFYAGLLFGITFILRVVYGIYCKKHFEETTIELKLDKRLLKEMSSFSSWSLFGNLAFVAYNHGLNLLLNVFFGPTVNAARGIAMQVQFAVSSFSNNFQTALNPQITKSFARKELDYMHSLVYSSSKYSYFLLLLLSLPLFIETELILQWWLKIVPSHTVNFVRIILLTTLVNAIANPLLTSALATGKIRNYQIIIGGLLLLILPLSYIALKFLPEPEIVFLIYFVIIIVAQFVRVWMMRSMINMSIREYFKQVILRIIFVTILSTVIPVIIFFILPKSVLSFFIVCLSCFISVFAIVISMGLNLKEKTFLKQKLTDLMLKTGLTK